MIKIVLIDSCFVLRQTNLRIVIPGGRYRSCKFFKNIYGIFCFACRVRATNTQLGQEENSNYIQLSVDSTQTIDVPPSIVVPPQDVVVARHSPVTELQCIANARPLYELEMIWLKDGKLIEESGVPYSFNDLWNRTLSLLSVDFVHQGTYTCAVRMRTGGPVLRESAKVRVIGTYF